MKQMRKQDTSWEKVASWYNKLVKSENDYHKRLIIPKTLQLLNLNQNNSVLDLACGQGVLANNLPCNIYYQGVDISNSLIEYARKNDKNLKHNYKIADITKKLPIEKNNFTHATIILALQNVEDPKSLLINVNKYLVTNGKLAVVINHPCFRIPRQTSWEIDEKNKIQYRRINRYLSPLKIPINMHPGSRKSSLTWSFHFSISDYSQFLQKAGFVIEKIEELASNKLSVGKTAKMENRSREEIPMFLSILARKDKEIPL